MSQPARAESKKLKEWYDEALLRAMVERFEALEPSFDGPRFLALASDRLGELEMMDRVRQIASALAETLPGPTARDMDLLVAAMGPPLPIEHGGEGMVGSGFHLWPFGELIGKIGLDDWPASWRAMEELTQRLSSEFAIRPFLAADLPQSLARLGALIKHPSHHVRRWVSEGTRTRLPWAKAVPALKGALVTRLGFLEILKDDPSLYVRRSVANHLQDILKDDPEAGLAVLQRWASLGDANVDWVVKHAARGLLKAGHPRVMELFGLHRPVEVRDFSAAPVTLSLGSSVELRATVSNPTGDSVPTRIDFALQGPTPSGKRFRKVFRWSDAVLEAGAEIRLSKHHPFIERSTRKLPAGDYHFTVLVNGRALGEQQVRLRL